MYQIDFHKPMHIHFIGIGGISMSGLAEILLKEGFSISGSDSRKSAKSGAVIRPRRFDHFFVIGGVTAFRASGRRTECSP